MLDSLFGSEMPLAVRFFLAFLIVLVAIGVAAWALRRFGTGRLGGANARGRQPRLGVIDYASVDGRRRLILVRRDSVEHLLMIGGPTDVVVESNIVRAQPAAARDVSAVRPAAGLDALPRAIPLPENGNGNGLGSWPLAPEPAPSPRLSPRVEPLPDELTTRPLPPLPEGAPSRPQRDTLAALADELSTRPAMPARPRPSGRPQTEEVHAETKAETRIETKIEPRSEPKPEPKLEPKIEARAEPKFESRPEPRKAPPPMSAPLATPAPAAAAETADQTLADMAQRLEAALRKSPEARTVAPAESRPPRSEPRPPRPEVSSEPRSAKADSKSGPSSQSGQSKTALYDSLEQEMASLLGRPTKT